MYDRDRCVQNQEDGQVTPLQPLDIGFVQGLQIQIFVGSLQNKQTQ